MKAFIKSISLCMLFVFLASSVSFAMEKQDDSKSLLAYILSFNVRLSNISETITDSYNTEKIDQETYDNLMSKWRTFNNTLIKIISDVNISLYKENYTYTTEYTSFLKRLENFVNDFTPFMQNVVEVCGNVPI
jgi:hypothetical protein